MEIIKLIVIIWTVSELLLSVSDFIPFKGKYIWEIPLGLVKAMLECKTCSSFWLGLILSNDLFLASLSSIIITIIQLIIDKITRTEL